MMAWIGKAKWWLIGIAVGCLSIAVYFIFTGDEKKKALKDLAKWSISKRTEVINSVIEDKKIELTQNTDDINNIKKKIEEIDEAKHDITNREESKLSQRELAQAWQEILAGIN